MSALYFVMQETLFFAIPLLVVSLGGLFSEKSGVTNIALEGIMIIGAYVGVITINSLGGTMPAQLLFFLAIAAAAVAGGLYSLLHAWASIRLKADQTISGTALNLFAPAFCIFTARAMFGARFVSFQDSFHIEKIPVLGDIPVLGPMFFSNCYLSTYFGILLLAAVAFLLKKTRFGMRLSACGEHPEAAASVGIPVAKMRYIGVLLSGILGGIGGVIFIIPTSTTFSATVAGYGFLALAVLILGQWKPVRVLLASLFFGLLKAVSSTYSGIPFLAKLPIPSEIYKMIPYVLTLAVLAVSSGRSRAPKALGALYDDGKPAMTGKKRTVLISVVSVVLVAVIVLTAVAPHGTDKKNAVSDGYGAEIGVLIEAGTSIDDKSYLQNVWESVVAYSDQNHLTRKYYQGKDTSLEGMTKCLEIAVKGNAKYVVAATNSFEPVVGSLQEKYPDTIFILLDGEPRDPKTNEIRYTDNTISVFFAEEQAGFLAGYATVMDGFRNLGYVGGMAMTSVIRYGYGFVAGCDYAAKELGLEPGAVSIKYNYAGSFLPNPESQAMASSWYHSGVEAIFACAGGLGDSIVKAAENTGKYVIQVDQDKSADSETILTSAIKDIPAAFSHIFSYVSGEDPELGRNITLTAADNCVALPMKTSRFRSFSEEQYQKIYKTLASGAIKIPTPDTVSDIYHLGCDHVKLEVIK